MKSLNSILKDQFTDHVELLKWQSFVAEWERQRKYVNKYAYYQKILRRGRRLWLEYAVSGPIEVTCAPVEIETHRQTVDSWLRKEALLGRLVKLSELLIISRDRNLEAEFVALEAQVLLYLTESDRYWGNRTSDLEVYFVSKSDHLAFAHARIRILLRKLNHFFRADRREKMRAIVRFLFKNMDDEAHLNNVVFAGQSVKHHSIKNLHQYGEEADT